MIRKIKERERKEFNSLASHPLQAWEWGEFRKETDIKVVRLGRWEKDQLVETAQITFHRIPGLPWSVGYWPKGEIPSNQMIKAVKKEAKVHKAIMVKLEPNVLAEEGKEEIEELKKDFRLAEGRSLFTKWSFWLDLKKDTEDILMDMKSKTRYNIRYADRQGVKVVKDNSWESFDKYWRLMKRTMDRQNFYAHDKSYHKLMFKNLKGEIAHLFRAEYEGETLTAWIVFVLNGVLYYPYGASTRKHKNVQASSRMTWEVIKFGKDQGCTLFDMWGSPGPKPEKSDPWYGFWRFKKGFGAKIVEFVGSWDLVLNPFLYPAYRIGNTVRWTILRWKAKLK